MELTNKHKGIIHIMISRGISADEYISDPLILIKTPAPPLYDAH